MECTISTVYDQLPNSCRVYINPSHIEKLDLNYNSVVVVDNTPVHIWPNLKVKLFEIGIGDVIGKLLSKGIGDVVKIRKISKVKIASHLYIEETFEPPVLSCLKDSLLVLKYVQLGAFEFKALGLWFACTIIDMYPKKK